MSKLKKPRNYSDFTLDHLQEMFGLRDKLQPLHLEGSPLTPSEWLIITLDKQKQIPIATEKAKSELLISPILVEIHSRNVDKFNLFSGYTFDVDPAQSLKGRCDFLLAKAAYSLNIEAPIFGIFEAKDDNVDKWLGQCGAEMYAVRLFNQMSHEPLEIIYGAVTNGYEWLFLRLENDTLQIDTERYSLHDLPKLLGVWQKVIDFYR